ncbi:MAG: heparinase II/III family protein, partial [Saprospiraceae bacterium]|nr:heparinase II/III family protein [Saprospiraceae bacterium]
NWFVLQQAGVLYQFTKEEKYASYVKEMLMQYAELYPTLGLHPTNRSYATGKLFWQCLNDANWLVYTSQAYDCIYHFLSVDDRRKLEENLFRPFADFLSIENPQFFNRVHNHSTWGNAAVGMIGLVMKDEELIDRALYGLRLDNSESNGRDNDGGLIRQAGQKSAGFFAQLDFSFSPDGYFTEGPYYLRYAIYPFLLFSEALANNKPHLDILNYRGEILKKAVYSLLLQCDPRGEFFPINDAQKGMSNKAREVVAAVDLAYLHFGKDESLLSLAQEQQKVTLDEAGFSVASDLAKGLGTPFTPHSIAYTDGAKGNRGGVGILRSKDKEADLCLVFKYSDQGMGHGHFDKLSYSLYDEKGEILQDYGAARWVNVDQKGGGRYLPENNSWAKQSLAHNTLVINETSHFEGDIAIGEKYHPELYLFDASDDKCQIVSAKDRWAYPGSEFHRTMAMIEDDAFDQPVVLDILRVTSESPSQYDLPHWFQGHLISTDFAYTANTSAQGVLGEKHGYQHVWKEASGRSRENLAKITWFGHAKFYSLTTAVDPNDELIFARLGANDQEFNLRRDPAFIVRKREATEAVFASVIEPHGRYDYASEIPQQPFSKISEIQVIYNDADYTICEFTEKGGKVFTVLLANQDRNNTSVHQVLIEDKNYRWEGPCQMVIK